jgi:hypothetical protein
LATAFFDHQFGAFSLCVDVKAEFEMGVTRGHMDVIGLFPRAETICFPSDALSRVSAADTHATVSEPRSLSYWAAEIKECWAHGTAGTLRLAKTTTCAKAKLRYGEWTRLWRTVQMPFSKRKGEMLVVIGNTMGDLDAQNSAHLPIAWNTLYCLAALGRTLIEDLIGQGKIHPKLTLAQAKTLVAAFQAPLERGRTPLRIRQRLRRFASFVRTTLSDWSEEDRDFACTELSGLLVKIQTQQPSREI